MQTMLNLQPHYSPILYAVSFQISDSFGEMPTLHHALNDTFLDNRTFPKYHCTLPSNVNNSLNGIKDEIENRRMA